LLWRRHRPQAAAADWACGTPGAPRLRQGPARLERWFTAA